MSIFSELSRLVKALGGKKKANSISANLHQLADMAENGEISSGGTPGYTVTENIIRTTIIPEQSVTTADIKGIGIYSANLDSNIGPTENVPDALFVVFNGTTYYCENQNADNTFGQYGAPYDNDSGVCDFSEIPFCIGLIGSLNQIITESAATVTVSAYTETTEKTVEVTEDFKAAVNESGIALYVTLGGTEANITYDKTAAEVYAAALAKRPIYFVVPTQMVDSNDDEGYYPVLAQVTTYSESDLAVLYVSLFYSRTSKMGDASYTGCNFFDISMSVSPDEFGLSSTSRYTLEGKVIN